MLKTVIIDDDEKNRSVLRELLIRLQLQVKVLGEAENAREGVQVIRKLQPELVFLDIEMPYGNAFDLLDELSPINFEIIFISAFSEYSLKAFRYSALDYLLKPVDAGELKEAVERAARRVGQRLMGEQVENLLFNLRNANTRNQRLALPTREGYDFIETGEILYCQARDYSTSIVLLSGKKYLSPRPLGDYERILSEDSFFRVHHSYIINISLVKKFHKSGRGGYVELTDGTQVEVSYRKKEKFLAKFGLK